VMSRCHG